MALTISCPTAAQLALREHVPTHPPHSVESLTKEFLKSVNVTEAKVRELALVHRQPLSGIVRSLILKKYPDIAPHWPKPVHSVKKVEGFAKRSRSPIAPLSEAVKYLIPFLNHEEDGQTTRRAREFALANGAVLVDGKYQLKE